MYSLEGRPLQGTCCEAFIVEPHCHQWCRVTWAIAQGCVDVSPQFVGKQTHDLECRRGLLHQDRRTFVLRDVLRVSCVFDFRFEVIYRGALLLPSLTSKPEPKLFFTPWANHWQISSRSHRCYGAKINASMFLLETRLIWIQWEINFMSEWGYWKIDHVIRFVSGWKSRAWGQCVLHHVWVLTRNMF